MIKRCLLEEMKINDDIIGTILEFTFDFNYFADTDTVVNVDYSSWEIYNCSIMHENTDKLIAKLSENFAASSR